MPASRLSAPLILILTALISASISPARAQNCYDYARHFHWLSRTMLSGEFAHIALREPYGYLTDSDTGLQVLDLTDPIHPQYVRSVDLPGQPWDVCLRGNYAYVSAYDQGLHIVDISDPVNPVLTGSVWTASAINLKVFGSFAYVADFFSSRVYVIAVSDPANPEIVADVQTPSWAWDVAIVEDEKLMVVSATYSVLTVDISDPFSPVRVGTVPVPDAVFEVDVDGRYAYVAGVVGLYVIDLEDPAHPAIVGEVPIVGSESILVRDGFAFLSVRDNGVTVVDVRNPVDPRIVGHCFLQGWVFGFAVSGDLLYAVDYWRDLNVFRIEHPAAVRSLGFLDTRYAVVHVSIAEPYAYMVEDIGRLIIADVSDPASPQPLGQLDLAGGLWGIAHDGGYAYLACDPPGLRIVDVSEPENPMLVGSVETGGRAIRIDVRGGYAYVLSESSGLSIVDVNDPTDPRLVGTLHASGSDLELYGSVAYLATESGVGVADISDPADPRLLGAVDVGFRPRCVVTDEGHLFVAGEGDPQTFTGSFGSLSLADPIHPVMMDRIATLRGVWDAERHGTNVWLAEDDAPILLADISAADDLKIGGMIEVAEVPGDYTWDIAVGNRLAVAGQGGYHSRVITLPCDLPIAPYAGGAGSKLPASTRAAALVSRPGESILLGFDSLGRTAEVQIFDVSGRIVRRLALDGAAAGPIGVTWDTKTDAGLPAAPGVYFARTSDGRRQEARRLILVR